MQSWHGVILDIVALICITVLLALKVIPSEAGFGVFGMIVGARAALVRSPDGGSGGSSVAASGAGKALGAVAGIAVGLASALGSAPKMGRQIMRTAIVATAVFLAVIIGACSAHDQALEKSGLDVLTKGTQMACAIDELLLHDSEGGLCAKFDEFEKAAMHVAQVAAVEGPPPDATALEAAICHCIRYDIRGADAGSK